MSPFVPVEDSLDDPNYQDPDTDLPEMVTGNDDADDTEGETDARDE